MKQIPRFPDYKITSDGRVWSEPRPSTKGGWLKPELDTHGRLCVNLYKNRKLFKRRIHRLVLETYIGQRPDGMQCRHLNGDPRDNRLENLCWGTPKENHADAIKHGTHTCLHQDSDHIGNKKLTTKQVKKIKNLLKQGITQQEIGSKYNVDQSTIAYINIGKTWKNVC